MFTTRWSPTDWTGQRVLDLHPGDIYWCTADPGWVTGVSYGIIAPLANGATLVVDEAEFDAQPLVRHSRTGAGQRLVHRADRHSHVDESRGRTWPGAAT